MNLIQQTFLLFLLNIFDAVLTIMWVRSGVAIEGNQLMAALLDIGNWPFLAVKIAVGAVMAMAVMHAGDRRLSRWGVTIALAVYIGLMGVHLFTALAAVGVISPEAVHVASQAVFTGGI